MTTNLSYIHAKLRYEPVKHQHTISKPNRIEVKTIMEYLKITHTSARCPKCGQKLQASDIKTYPFVCKHCDENFYAIEARQNSHEQFNVFIPLEKKARDLIYFIKPLAEECGGHCQQWSEKSNGVYITFDSRFYAVDITEFNNKIRQIPYLKIGTTLYKKVIINKEPITINGHLCRISPNGLEYTDL